MKKLLLLPIFLILISATKAQDRIININHDTIYCKIVAINNEGIVYELKNNDGSLTGKNISLSQVSEYTRSPQPEIKKESHRYTMSKSTNLPEHLWNLCLNVGASTMPWYISSMESDSEMPEYYNNLTKGFHINTSAHYMLNSYLGVGAEYSFFNTSFSTSVPLNYSPSMFLVISEKYREYINFLGPSVLFQQQVDVRQKFTFSESLTAGVLFFRMENSSIYPNVDNLGYTDITRNSLFTGNCFSAKLGLTATYRLSKNFSVGFGGDFIWASLKKGSMESRGPNNESSSDLNDELPNALNLSRIDYSIALRYHF